jgi:hypothetical protein
MKKKVIGRFEYYAEIGHISNVERKGMKQGRKAVRPIKHANRSWRAESGTDAIDLHDSY